MSAAVHRVERCERSTITEAWTSVLGLPAPIDDTDAPVLDRAARASIPGLVAKPAVVAVNVPRDRAPLDVSQYFRLNVAVDVGQPDAGLLGMHTMFRLYDAELDADHIVSLTADVHPDAEDRISIITKVIAESRASSSRAPSAFRRTCARR